MNDLVKRLQDDPGLADCEEAADRIAQLEARVAAADKLAEALTAYNRGGAGPLTGWLDVEQAHAAYEAIKEANDG